MEDVFYSPQFECEWNQYHNIHHTYEVVEMVAFLILSTDLKRELTPFERSMALVAALCHDFGHNGKSNSEWDNISIRSQNRRIPSICSNMSSETLSSYGKTNTSTDSPPIKRNDTEEIVKCLTESLANSKSYNEVMHLDLSVWVVFKHKKTILENRSNATISSILSTLILATDLQKHDDYLPKCVRENLSSLDKMVIVLKLADISHVLRPFRVHAYWVYNLIRETNKLSHARKSFEKCVPSVEYMANDTINFAEKFVGDLLDKIMSFYPGFPPELLANYAKNLNTWRSYI